MSVFVEEGAVSAGYEEVRSDDNETQWVVCTYEGKQIAFAASGADYDEFLSHMTDDARVYGYLRIETGDEISRRAKFAFVTWIGPSVSPLKKAKVSTDKAFVKKLWQNFGKEILADDRAELKYEKIKSTLETASGAAYGTGK